VRLDLYEAMELELRPLGISRRQFLLMTGVGAVAAMLASCEVLASCDVIEQILEKIRNRPVRRDISLLTGSDPYVTAYANAVAALRALPISNKHSWDYQWGIHTNYCPHHNWLFLPWHREFVWRFEEICRQETQNESFTLPYWNWQKNPQVPAVFLNQGSPLYHQGRTATASSTIPISISGPQEMENILAQMNFLLFGSGSISATSPQNTFASAGPLEGTPHDNIHGFVGGDMGYIDTSPRDPIFWMHHNMIECVWVDWNLKRGNPNTNDPSWTGRRFTEFVDRAGNAVSVTPFDMVLYPLFLYRYDDPVLGLG